MRRTTAAIAGTAALALVLAACGGDDGDDPGGETDPENLSAELTWWDTSDPENEGPTFKSLIEKFNEEYPDVTINYQSVPFGEAQNKFKTAASSGSGAPDILRAEVAWVPEFASLGYLYALDGTSVLEDNDFLETPLSSNVYDDGDGEATYGVPQVTDTLGLMYNKALFEEAGLDPEAPPTNWDEVREAAKALKSKAGVDGIYLNAAGYFMLPFMYGEGGDLLDVDEQTITVGSEENIAGLTVAQEMVKDGTSAKPNAQDSYGTMMTLFKEGKVGMIINGPWEVANVTEDPNFGGFENLGIGPVPAGSVEAGSPVGGHNYVIWSGMDQEKEEAALAFVDFMASAESQAFIAEELGLLPANAAAYDLVEDNEKVSAWKGALDVSKARPWIPEGGLFFAPLDEAAVQVLVQGQAPAKVLGQVAETFKSDVVPDYDLP